MSITTASAHIVGATSVALGWEPSFTWVLDEVVVTGLLLFALFEDVFLSTVDTDFVFACIRIWRTYSVSLGVALFVGFGSEAFDASTSASSQISIESKSWWAPALESTIKVGAVVGASSVVDSTFVDINTSTVNISVSWAAGTYETFTVDKTKLLATTVVWVAWVGSACLSIFVESVSFKTSAFV
jgi:hypothetical protein